MSRTRRPADASLDLEPSERRSNYFKMLTARAITSPITMRHAVAWTVIANLAQRDKGITSVGLNAVAIREPEVEVVEELGSPPRSS